MSFKLTLWLISALLAGCAAKPDDYVIPGSSQRLSKTEAERSLVEQALAPQVKPPLDRPLKVVNAVLPSYPVAWKRLDHAPKQTVTVRFVVSETGTILEPVIVGVANPELVDLCLADLSHWRFEPPLREGKPAPLGLTFRFVFVLED